MTAPAFDVWTYAGRVVFLVVQFCVSCLPALLYVAIRSRRYGRAVLYGLFIAVYAWAFLLGWPYASFRLRMLLIDVAILAVASFCILGQPTRRRLHFRRAIAAANIMLGLGAVVFLPLSSLSPLRMVDAVAQAAKSPDGRYEAALIYREGPTAGYFVIALRPTTFSWTDALDYPHTIMVQVAADGLNEIRWSGNRSLVVAYDPDATFQLRQPRWRDVNIVYRKSADDTVIPER